MFCPILPAIILLATVSSMPSGLSIAPKGVEQLIHTLLLNQLALTDTIEDKNNCDSVQESMDQLRHNFTRELAAITANVEQQRTVINDFIRDIKASMHDLHVTLPQDIKAALEESHSSIIQNLASSKNAEQSILQTTIRDTIAEQLVGNPHASNRGIDSGLVEMTGVMPFRIQDINVTDSHQDYSGRGKPVDCLGYRRKGAKTSGVYEIYPVNCSKPVLVWCDMVTDGGGWTVILARGPQVTQEVFSRTWSEYEVGFGNPATEYWIGNEIIHKLTGEVPHTLRLDAEDFGNTRRFAEWFTFSVGDSESKYKLTVGDFQKDLSTTGDSLAHNNGIGFSTLDRDNDANSGKCTSSTGSNGGWWHKSCTHSVPTGPIKNTNSNSNSMTLYYWDPKKTGWTSLSWLQLKIQPKDSQGPVRMCQG